VRAIRAPRSGRIPESELVLGPGGGVYHLALHPEQLARDVILVGDPGRVERVSARFDRVEHRASNREFVSHTGTLGARRLSVVSTGIGTDNVDIVVNELDALVNVDLERREVRARPARLRLVRLGTSGCLQEDIPLDSPVASRYALGLDGLLGFYAAEPDPDEAELVAAFRAHAGWRSEWNPPYAVHGSDRLLEVLGAGLESGVTLTANGFYGPQGRELRLPLRDPGLNQRFRSFRHGELRLTNFEMECSALYGLAALLGHEACTLCVVIADREGGRLSADPHAAVEALLDLALERMLSLPGE
jgi:uridine phosphorylase